MEKYVIKGGKKLSGKIEIESAKNAVLPILAGCILTEKEVVIKNCPKIIDVLNMIKILNEIGVKTRYEEKNLIVDASTINGFKIPKELSKELRSSIFTLGALIARLNRAVVAYPGGCDIGIRPIDIHLTALKELGVKIEEHGGEISCVSSGVVGKEIFLDFPSVGATENVILASVFCTGKTIIRNCAREPEIIDLMNFLNKLGANVVGAGSNTIEITGVKKLNGCTYKPISDRIEAGTYLISTAITGGEIEIHNSNSKNISSLLHKISNNTCKITINNDIIYYKFGGIRKSINVSTNPYPAFPTDLQAQITALSCVSHGTSFITENVFEMRFKHVPELVKMGARISVYGKTAVVNGIEQLNGAPVTAQDLRGGAGLVLAGLNANGVTEVYGVKHIERGYFNLVEKLVSLGADIRKEF